MYRVIPSGGVHRGEVCAQAHVVSPSHSAHTCASIAHTLARYYRAALCGGGVSAVAAAAAAVLVAAAVVLLLLPAYLLVMVVGDR